MAKKLSYERYYWFHGRVKANRYPNATTLAENCGISVKQAQRDITFMHERLKAPLEYNKGRRGYRYSDGSYELPPVWFNEEELTALCLAMRLSAAIPDRKLKSDLNEILRKFIIYRAADSVPSLADIEAMISVKNIEYYRVDENIFRQTVGALLQRRPVRINYRTPHTGSATERAVLPLHIMCYMGNWHLIAYCALKGGLRDFALSRIRGVEPASRPIEIPAELPPAKEYLRKNFGIMSNADPKSEREVCLKFEPEASEWISEQIWHRGQKMTACKNGSVILKFTVADLREVKREVLKYGASVKVISPPELWKQVREEIEKMKKNYT